MTAGSTLRAGFGEMPDGRDVEMHTLTNARGMEACVLGYGGIIQSLRVPDAGGHLIDVTPGYDTLEGYLADTRYFGALIGRYANRIAGGHFELDGTSYDVSRNHGDNLLHGGISGFSRVVWMAEPFAGRSTTGVVLSHVSEEGDDGFPGTLSVRVTYSLSDDNELRFDYFATTDAPTPVNLTQHMYVNLAGHQSADVLDHELQLSASSFTPVDASLLPTGEVRRVAGTAFDFTSTRTVGSRITAEDPQLALAAGYDHNFIIDGVSPGALVHAATLRHPATGRTMEIETTEPGIQFYSGNHIAGGPVGKGGFVYGRHSSLALETQHFPDSPNHPSFPSTILRPGAEFNSTTVYRFR